MKVVILAGGFGTRLSEYTESVPKPMVELDGKPLIWHIMKGYAKFGFNEFLILTGYKSSYIKNYFLDYSHTTNDISLNTRSGSVQIINQRAEHWDIQIVDTGIDSLTGRRLTLASNFLPETFLLTYGDGLSDVDITKVIELHNSGKFELTLTSVRPNARFGEIDLKGNKVVSFAEKPQLSQGWINGGFFVVQKSFLSRIKGNVMLEQSPILEGVNAGVVGAYKHYNFWQCVDTKRDLERLEVMCRNGSQPWR